MGLLFNLWLRFASEDELYAQYDKDRTTKFFETGDFTRKMDKINNELSRRADKQWKNDPRRSKDSNYRWTDRNRWED